MVFRAQEDAPEDRAGGRLERTERTLARAADEAFGSNGSSRVQVLPSHGMALGLDNMEALHRPTGLAANVSPRAVQGQGDSRLAADHRGLLRHG